jgi:hypothetical protein
VGVGLEQVPSDTLFLEHAFGTRPWSACGDACVPARCSLPFCVTRSDARRLQRSAFLTHTAAALTVATCQAIIDLMSSEKRPYLLLSSRNPRRRPLRVQLAGWHPTARCLWGSGLVTIPSIIAFSEP